MALDYFAYHTEPDFNAVIAYNNPWTKNGKTGYESFYTDMKEFLYEFATLLLATAQAAGLVWISTVFVR